MRTAEHSARELGSRTSRQRLPEQSRPYFTHIQDGLSLGYRRGKRGGSWIARAYDIERGYRYEPLGKSNDLAEGLGMSFQEAQDASRRWYTQLAHIDAGELAPGRYTVEQAMAEYLKDRERFRRKKLSRTRSVINTHILPFLGDVELSKLTHKRVKSWRDGVAEASPRIRTKKGVEPAYRQVDASDADALRKRQATANRIFTVFRAALNHAYKENKVASKASWEKITPFREVDVPKVRYLSVAECKRLIHACPSDFRALVRGALYTGCRYGELTEMRVDAFNRDAGTIHIPRSKSGKGRYIPLTKEGSAFFETMTADRADDESMFTHAEGIRKAKAWEHSQQRYWIELACKDAEIAPSIGFHILRHTYASQLAMNGTPMPVIAALLGHADTRMTEKHYGHLSPSYVADTLRANLPSFGFQASKRIALVAQAG